MDTTKLNARLKAKEELIEQKTSQLAQLIKNIRKNYRQDDTIEEEPQIDLRPHNNRNSVTAGQLTRPIGTVTRSLTCEIP